MHACLAVIDARSDALSIPDLPLETVYDDISILQFQSRRLSAIENIDNLVIATTNRTCDNKIATMAEAENILCFRSDAADTLGTLLLVANQTHAQTLAYISPANPFCDPDVISSCLARFQSNNCEYSRLAENVIPNGFGTEILSTKILHHLGDQAHLTEDMRENVLDFIYQRPDVFRACRPTITRDVNPPNHGVSINNEADLEMLRAIYATLQEREWPVDLEHVCKLLDEFSVLNSIITGLAS